MSWAAAEPLPERLVDAPWRRSGRLPAGHQIPVGAGRRAPVRRGRQGLRLRRQLLLGHPGRVTSFALGGELGLAPAGVRGPGAGEAVPELVVGGPVQPGQRLPLVQQGAKPVHPAAPVVAGGEALRFDDELFLGRPGLLLLPVALGPARGALGADDRQQRVQPVEQPLQVAHGMRVDDDVAYRPDRCQRIVGGQRTRVDPGLQQVDLELKRLEPAGEEGQGLLSRHVGYLTHAPFAVARPDIDGAVAVHAAERGRAGRSGRAYRVGRAAGDWRGPPGSPDPRGSEAPARALSRPPPARSMSRPPLA